VREITPSPHTDVFPGSQMAREVTMSRIDRSVVVERVVWATDNDPVSPGGDDVAGFELTIGGAADSAAKQPGW
jgi:hypothetical protein